MGKQQPRRPHRGERFYQNFAAYSLRFAACLLFCFSLVFYFIAFFMIF